MTREEAIKRLSDIRADYSCFDDDERLKCHALSMAIEALQDDWIPVRKDGYVPDYEVMCQDRYGSMMFGYASVVEYGIWLCEDDNTMMDDVVAWRHLPAPYKESDSK